VLFNADVNRKNAVSGTRLVHACPERSRRADCGLRIADYPIADCGLRIAECGMRTVLSLSKGGLPKALSLSKGGLPKALSLSKGGLPKALSGVEGRIIRLRIADCGSLLSG